MKREPTTETATKALVKSWLDSRGAWSFANVNYGMGVHGLPDRLAALPVTVTQAMVGRRIALFVAVESKRPGRRGEADRGMSKHQVLVMEAIKAAGGYAIVCDGREDLEWLEVSLDQLVRG